MKNRPTNSTAFGDRNYCEFRFPVVTSIVCIRRDKNDALFFFLCIIGHTAIKLTKNLFISLFGTRHKEETVSYVHESKSYFKNLENDLKCI